MTSTNLDQVQDDPMMNLINVCSDNNTEEDSLNDSPFNQCTLKCEYEDPNQLSKNLNNNNFCYFHINIQGLLSHWDNFTNTLNDMQNPSAPISIIGLSEIFMIPDKQIVQIPNYSFEYKSREPPSNNRGGIGLYIHKSLKYKIAITKVRNNCLSIHTI